MSEQQIVIGIDPGGKGAMVAVDRETRRIVDCYDFCKLGDTMDVQGIIDWLRRFNPTLVPIISENVHPGIGSNDDNHVKTVHASFIFGRNVAFPEAIAMTLGFKYEKVYPSVWKTYFALCSSASTYEERKTMSVDKACAINKQDAEMFRYLFRRGNATSLVEKHDRAEAYLIALYGIEKSLI